MIREWLVAKLLCCEEERNWQVASFLPEADSANFPFLSAFSAEESRQLNTLRISIYFPAKNYWLMEDSGGLAGLRGLHQDLLALETSQLANVERLWADLEARVTEFRTLLDKQAKNEKSRKALALGIIFWRSKDSGHVVGKD